MHRWNHLNVCRCSKIERTLIRYVLVKRRAKTFDIEQQATLGGQRAEHLPLRITT